MTLRAGLAAGAAAVVLAAGGVTASQLIGGSSVASAGTVTTKNCNDWSGELTEGECFAAGTLRYVALYNIQGAGQFCKWKAANPGEWSRIQDSAKAGKPASSIVTWFGGALKNIVEAYQATGAPTFTIEPNESPNVCTGKLVAPPVASVAGVTDTSATVTIGG